MYILSSLRERNLPDVMFCLWALSALLLQATATLTAASSSNCTDAVHYDTISMFSHAPLTFSYEVPDDAACAAKCGRIATCRAWLYSTSGQECQLYRDNPVSQAQSPHFVSGSCDTFSGSSGGVSTSVLAAPSQSLIPQQPEPSHHAKRERSHRHSHHGHGHSH